MSGPMLREMERLYAIEDENERLRATIADLTAALEIAATYLPALPDRPPRFITEDKARQECEQVRAALARAQGGTPASVSTADLDARDMRLNRGP